MKWENLMRKYKELITPPIGSSTKEGVPTQWPFFEIVHDFMSSHHTIQPPLLIDTSIPSTSHETPSPQTHLPLSQFPSLLSTVTSCSKEKKPSARKRKSSDIDEVILYLKEEDKREEERNREMMSLF
ncbi:hypothetical protein PR048_017794 [Dryococelus australis]|uniref:MADF domain-containing protein n=1 Tax=Dryococelus australis TaxID=614101 RepID=A0ABQ9HAJ6_9NEOP|nr:hypothetical protein PR048_017794 [Dryococelus australis]